MERPVGGSWAAAGPAVAVSAMNTAAIPQSRNRTIRLFPPGRHPAPFPRPVILPASPQRPLLPRCRAACRAQCVTTRLPVGAATAWRRRVSPTPTRGRRSSAARRPPRFGAASGLPRNASTADEPAHARIRSVGGRVGVGVDISRRSRPGGIRRSLRCSSLRRAGGRVGGRGRKPAAAPEAARMLRNKLSQPGGALGVRRRETPAARLAGRYNLPVAFSSSAFSTAAPAAPRTVLCPIATSL